MEISHLESQSKLLVVDLARQDVRIVILIIEHTEPNI